MVDRCQGQLYNLLLCGHDSRRIRQVWNDAPKQRRRNVSEEYINEIFSPDFYNLHFWFFDDTVQAIGFDGQFIVVDFNNDLIILRNSLYHPLHSGDYTLCIAQAFVCADSTGPVTLPEALLGVSSEFSMSEFLRILKTP